MKHYEVTFVVDPVLSGDEIKATEKAYEDMLKNEGCAIVHVDEMGLRQLAYPINKRSSGIFYCIEFTSESGDMIGKMELAMKRDERLMRFLTIALDRHGVKYNADKRAGLIGKVKKKTKGKAQEETAAEAKASEAKAAAEAKATEAAKTAAAAAAEEVVTNTESAE